jgi:hypothetical protein
LGQRGVAFRGIGDQVDSASQLPFQVFADRLDLLEFGEGIAGVKTVVIDPVGDIDVAERIGALSLA